MKIRVCGWTLALISLGAVGSGRGDGCNGVSNNLVTNCGFETGTFSGYTGTTTSNIFSGIDAGDPIAMGNTPYQGASEAYLGAIDRTATLSQLLTTTPGQTYEIEFALLNDTTPIGGYSNSFAVSFGGATIFSKSNAPADGYQLETFFAIATSGSTALSFKDQNQTGDFELDSISVAPAATVTPEPPSLALVATALLGGWAQLETKGKSFTRRSASGT